MTEIEEQAPAKKRKPPGKPIVRRGQKPPAQKVAKRLPPGHQSYQNLPWAQVRRDYEATDVSVAGLTRRYGIKSDGTVRKRIAAEGWSKDVDAIAASLVQAGMLARAEDSLTPYFQRAARFVIPPPVHPALVIDAELVADTSAAAIMAAPLSGAVEEVALSQATPPPQAAVITHAWSIAGQAQPPAAITREAFGVAVGPLAAAFEADRLTQERGGPAESTKQKTTKEFQRLPGGEIPGVRTRKKKSVPTEAPSEAAGADAAEGGDGTSEHTPLLSEVPATEPDEMKLKLARGLAGMHIQVNSEQMLNAERMELVGNVLLARIMTAIAPVDLASQHEARMALTFINPERETLAGLLKATSDLLERAALMKRRALNMDPKLGTNGLHPPANLLPMGGGVVRTPSEIAQLAQGLPLDILMQLRGVAAAVARLPPGQRPGAVPAPTADPA